MVACQATWSIAVWECVTVSNMLGEVRREYTLVHDVDLLATIGSVFSCVKSALYHRSSLESMFLLRVYEIMYLSPLGR